MRRSKPLTVSVLMLLALGIGMGTVTAQTVDGIDTSFSDTNGDGVNDSLTVEVNVTEDGGVTAAEVNGPIESLGVPSSEDGDGQAPVTNISDNTVRFGSTGYTGTYFVNGTLKDFSDGDTVEVTAWIGGVNRSQADDLRETSVTLSTPSDDKPETNISDTEAGSPNDDAERSGNNKERNGGEGMPGFTYLAAVLALVTAVTTRL